MSGHILISHLSYALAESSWPCTRELVWACLGRVVGAPEQRLVGSWNLPADWPANQEPGGRLNIPVTLQLRRAYMYIVRTVAHVFSLVLLECNKLLLAEITIAFASAL